MGRSDREHFKTYTEQNRLKHVVHEKYFSAYLRALGRHAAAFHYIDGFAGCGLYADRHEGSPLIALRLLEAAARPFSASFVENDPELFRQLDGELQKRGQILNLLDGPLLKNGEFHQFIDEILARPIYTRFPTAATFAFIDPCGVQGVRMQDIFRILAKPFGECLLFWNYDGINRWLGGVSKEEHDRAGLVDFFGSDSAVDEALRYYEPSDHSADKERKLLGLFVEALKAHRARFVVPLRVQARDRDRTSHYLIHCSSHPLAFKIMKDVMGGVTTSDESGAFEFSTAAETGALFHPIEDRAREEILTHLKRGPSKVEVFTQEWILRPHDYFRASDYKQMLLDLEARGGIEVLDKRGVSPAPLPTRRKGAGGKPTLADDYFVSLPKRR
jgi:three-Cys-motif partner protein